MVRFFSLGLSLMILVGCGADGEPLRPSAAPSESTSPSGVNVSGYETVGVIYE